ncbi:hypothetical protein BSU04_08495 [Caballeronia sordidicola]|uniref:Uncharacterized protein n=1 Tax=Caballeronia sordidicola TaxID=196367 RepID=A0A226X7U9_CABSO|nr:hypothetical protein BSU04_08495 [Caballeronia sordidicola]
MELVGGHAYLRRAKALFAVGRADLRDIRGDGSASSYWVH